MRRRVEGQQREREKDKAGEVLFSAALFCLAAVFSFFFLLDDIIVFPSFLSFVAPKQTPRTHELGRRDDERTAGRLCVK